MSLLADFRQTVRALGVLKPGDRVVIGVSGGPDSLALLHLFAHSRQALDLRLHVAHLDHQIRGEEAAAEARFVTSIAEEWDVPCHIERADVPALAARHKLALEEAARQARYTALGREAARLGAVAIAVGHNADDQAETVLMHLLRGSGLAGLRGMLPVTPLSDYHLLEPVDAVIGAQRAVLLIRPLLGVPRADIEAYCAIHNLKPRFDRSNLDTTYFRNRLRNEIIPLLETVNPNLRALLTRTASVIAADYEILEAQVRAAWTAITLEESRERVRFDLDKWRALPLALQRATVRQAAWHLRRSLRDVSYRHVEGAVRVAQEGTTGARATLPAGLMLYVDYDSLTSAPDGQQPPRPDWPLIEPGTVIQIDRPGVYELPGSTWHFGLQPYTGERSGASWRALFADPWAAPLDADKLISPMRIRARQPGDRFRPQGLGGTKKVNEFQIDVKISAVWRDHLPLLIVSGEIAWVCGWRVDERFVVRPDTKQVWVARFERSG